MNRKKPSKTPAPLPAAHPNDRSPAPAEPVNNVRVVREYVESLVVALVLAFFFKAFAAEAFVIPTGSMATTLMGRHKDVRCEYCRYPFQINASEEANDGGDRSRKKNLAVVLAGTCPQCRYTMYVGKDNFAKQTFLSYNGDRIFVNKTQFDFGEPTRWHVTVFRYPGDPKINYIKRLVGLEGETVRLRHGDVFVKKAEETEFEIQRKPLRALRAMLRPVDDNDYVVPKLHATGWPTRWFFDDGTWSRSEDFKTFEIDARRDDSAGSATGDASAGRTAWLNYRHVVPSSRDWFHLAQGNLPPGGVVHNPRLITDFVGYNSGIAREDPQYGNWGRDGNISVLEITENDRVGKKHFCEQSIDALGLNWVGDLAVSCRLDVRRPEGAFTLRLVKGGAVFLCRIALDSGEATLSIPDVPEFQPVSAPTPIRSGGSFDLMLCNVDEELRLIVDGREIDFELRGRYDALCRPDGPLPRDRSPTRADLTPVGLGVEGTGVRVEHLKVFRDLYYLAFDERFRPSNTSCDLIASPFLLHYGEESVTRILSDPTQWTAFGKTNAATFELDKDRFLMLGDNSAKSLDSRLWTEIGIPAGVHRDLLIGEAVFVYWPHGFRIPGTRLALIPNFAKVRFID